MEGNPSTKPNSLLPLKQANVMSTKEVTKNGVDCELHDIPQEYKSLVDAINTAGIYQLWYGRFPIEWDWYQRR